MRMILAMAAAGPVAAGQAGSAMEQKLPRPGPCADAADVLSTGGIVVLLHGIAGNRFEMRLLASRLKRRGYDVDNFVYPSTKAPIETHVDQLAAHLQRYRGRTVDFACHSMGGIIVRMYMDKYRPANVRRLVMIGTPNQGALLADRYGNLPPYRWAFGPAGQQLRRGERGACAGAGIPGCEFGVIAGGLGGKFGFSPFIPGDNDGTVAVAETKLDGMTDFAVVRNIHRFLHWSPTTAELTARFLETGRFTKAGATAQAAAPTIATD